METQEKSLMVVSEDNIFDKFRKYFAELLYNQKAIFHMEELNNYKKPKKRFKGQYIIPEPIKAGNTITKNVQKGMEKNLDGVKSTIINDMRFAKMRLIKLNATISGRFRQQM